MARALEMLIERLDISTVAGADKWSRLKLADSIVREDHFLLLVDNFGVETALQAPRDLDGSLVPRSDELAEAIRKGERVIYALKKTALDDLRHEIASVAPAVEPLQDPPVPVRASGDGSLQGTICELRVALGLAQAELKALRDGHKDDRAPLAPRICPGDCRCAREQREMEELIRRHAEHREKKEHALIAAKLAKLADEEKRHKAARDAVEAEKAAIASTVESFTSSLRSKAEQKVGAAFRAKASALASVVKLEPLETSPVGKPTGSRAADPTSKRSQKKAAKRPRPNPTVKPS